MGVEVYRAMYDLDVRLCTIACWIRKRPYEGLLYLLHRNRVPVPVVDYIDEPQEASIEAC